MSDEVNDWTISAVEYAMRKFDIESNETDIVNTAVKYANYRILDELRSHRRKTTVYVDDLRDEDQARNVKADIGASSVESFMSIKADGERAELARIAMRLFGRMMMETRVSDNNVSIFVEAYLKGFDTMEVAKRHGVSTNNVYQIINRIKKILCVVGPRIIDEYDRGFVA